MIANKTQAIQQALLGNYEQAISLNRELLKENPDDIETLNRLAYAYMILRKTKEAKDAYNKVLTLDHQNPVALKNLKRLSGLKNNGAPPPIAHDIDSMFIEEHGKTKVVELINTAQPNVLGGLLTGEEITLRIKRLKIFVQDMHNTYIGMLPEDIGKRLIGFMNGGNTYQACIKSVNKKQVTIFIRETKRVTRFKNQPSFITIEAQKNGSSGKSVQSKSSESLE